VLLAYPLILGYDATASSNVEINSGGSKRCPCHCQTFENLWKSY